MSASKKDLAKKARERFVLDQFIATSCRSLEIVEGGEEPDFVVSDAVSEFGLELAEVFKDRKQIKPGKLESPGKTNESRRAKYLQSVAEVYYAMGGLPLHVQALLPNGFDQAPHVIAECLVSARPKVPGVQEGFSFAPEASFLLRALPDEMGDYAKWVPVNNSVGWRRQDELDDVQEVIRAKSAKLARYRLVRPRVGLLLHADGTRSSGMISWSGEFGPVDSCGFDEVHLYIHPSQAWRLV